MKKKFLSMILVGAMVLSLCACNSSKPANSDNVSDATKTTKQAEDMTKGNGIKEKGNISIQDKKSEDDHVVLYLPIKYEYTKSYTEGGRERTGVFQYDDSANILSAEFIEKLWDEGIENSEVRENYTYDYNENNLLIYASEEPDYGESSYEYQDGRLIRIRSGISGINNFLTYSGNNYIKSEIESSFGNQVTEYQYNSFGDFINSTIYKTEEVMQKYPSNNNISRDEYYDFKYDELGRVVNCKYTRFTYDSEHPSKSPQKASADESVVYNEDGRLVSYLNNGVELRKFSYDEEGKLVEFDGNEIKYNNDGLVSYYDGFSLSYDNNGNLLKAVFDNKEMKQEISFEYQQFDLSRERYEQMMNYSYYGNDIRRFTPYLDSCSKRLSQYKSILEGNMDLTMYCKGSTFMEIYYLNNDMVDFFLREIIGRSLVISHESLLDEDGNKKLEVDSSLIKTPNSGQDQDYILPDCDSRYYSQEELEALSAEQLKLARNEIYARHGYIFQTGNTKNYFDSKSWYRATVTEVTDDMLNEYEIANRDLIISIENK